MKTKYLAAFTAAMLTAVFALGGCTPNYDDAPLKGDVVADFSAGAAETMFESNGWANGDPFNVVWDKSNVSYEDGKLSLGITKEDRTVYVNDEEVTFPYTAGEVRSEEHYGYGDFEVRMKPASEAGTASTFFTCTGPYDTDLEGNAHKHDEIDIEFLGKDTTKVQFNYFVGGKGGHEHMYNLGFDASLEYHDYGFRWEENAITWFVDGKPVYKVTKGGAHPELPSDPGRILMNYWCGTRSAEGWMGKYKTDSDATADYLWVKTNATGVDLTPTPDPQPSDTFAGDWSAVTAADLTFASTDKYTVAKNGDETNITYTEVAGNAYCNVNASITEAAAQTNWMHLTIKNNGTEASQVRVNVIDDALSGSSNASTNRRAYMDGAAVFTDLEWGGSFFEVPAGQTVQAEIYFAGTPDSLELMIDSSRNDSEVRSGDITISEIKFAKQGDIESVTGEDPEPDPQPSDTFAGDWSAVTAADLTFASTDKYTVAKNGDETNITYTEVAGNAYCNVNASITTAAAQTNWMHLTIKNNGTEASQVRVNVIDDALSGSSNASTNRRAYMDGAAVFTDLEWGGSFFDIPAGQTVQAEIYFAGTPDSLELMIDSSRNDSEVRSGDITISEIKFAKQGDIESITGGTPTPPAGDQTELAFGSTTEYTVDPSGTPANSFTVTYTDVGGQSYKNIVAEAAAIAEGKTTLSVKIKNNGTEAVRIRIDIQGTTRVDTSENGDRSGTDACNLSSTCEGGTDSYTDTKWGGTFVTVAAGEEATLTITFDGMGAQGAVKAILVYIDSSRSDAELHSGSVTLSDFIFG